jgi:hypothetical protein
MRIAIFRHFVFLVLLPVYIFFLHSSNPQIHDLTRCIQQDVPSVRLILTDHGLDRMFWKGKGAFIIGSTSPFKAIMIDPQKSWLITGFPDIWH